MRKEEYEIVSGMSAQEYTDYLLSKNGRPNKKYSMNIRSQRIDEGYIRHHTMETVLPALSLCRRDFIDALTYARQFMDIGMSIDEAKRIYKLAQQPQNLVFCTREEHTLLHNKIRYEYPHLRQLSSLMYELIRKKSDLRKQYHNLLGIEVNHNRGCKKYAKPKDYSNEVIIKNIY